MPDALVEIDGHVMIVTMNRPKRKNAMTLKMFARMADAWRQASAAPITPQAMPKRARLRHPKGPFKPSTPGSKASSPTSTSFITISPVIEVRSDSLPPIFGAERPLVPLSRTKPLILPPCASDLAQTTKTSAMGALEIHVLAPFRT